MYTINTYIHKYIHAYIHTHTHIHIYIYIYIYIHTYTRAYIHTYINTYIHKHIRTHTHTYTYKNTYIIHAHTHTHTHICIYKLINSMQQSHVQKSIAVPQTVKKFLAFCGSRRFSILFTRARLLLLSLFRSIQSTYSHSIYFGCIFILLSHLGFTHPNVSFFQISSSNILCHSIISHTCHMPPFTFFFVVLRPNAGHDLLILEDSRSHTATHHSR